MLMGQAAGGIGLQIPGAGTREGTASLVEVGAGDLKPASSSAGVGIAGKEGDSLLFVRVPEGVPAYEVQWAEATATEPKQGNKAPDGVAGNVMIRASALQYHVHSDKGRLAARVGRSEFCTGERQEEWPQTKTLINCGLLRQKWARRSTLERSSSHPS